MKVNFPEAGADVKESGLFSGAGHLEDGGLMSPSLSPYLSEGAERGNRTKRSRERGEKFSTCRRAQSILKRQEMVWMCHPGFTLSWIQG